MALFNRSGRDPNADVSQIEFQQRPDRRWPTLLAFVALALVITLGLFYGTRVLYRAVTDTEAPPITQNQPEKETPAPSPSPSQAPANLPSGESTTPSPSPSGLPDNGPGDVLKLFVGTSLLAGGLHYVVTTRTRLANK